MHPTLILRKKNNSCEELNKSGSYLLIINVWVLCLTASWKWKNEGLKSEKGAKKKKRGGKDKAASPDA